MAINLSIEDDINLVIDQESILTILRVGKRLIARSPVDKGSFKGNWYVEIGKNTGRRFDKRRTASTALGKIISILDPRIAKKGRPLPNKIFLYNPAPYGQPLNEGHSLQAEPFWIEREIAKGVKDKGRGKLLKSIAKRSRSQRRQLEARIRRR